MIVDNRKPREQRHLTPTGKVGSRARRISRERQRDIERENVMLLNKMMKINERGGRNLDLIIHHEELQLELEPFLNSADLTKIA